MYLLSFMTFSLLLSQFQQYSQSGWSLGRHFSGHFFQMYCFWATTEATKLFVSFFLLTGKARVPEYFLQK